MAKYIDHKTGEVITAKCDARYYIESTDKVVTYVVNPLIEKDGIARTAHHEVLHTLLHPLSDLAWVKAETQEEKDRIVTIEHEIIERILKAQHD